MPDKTPSFASIALDIGDPRLENIFREFEGEIKKETNNAEFTPLRSEVRSDVKRLKAVAKKFEKALDRVSKRLLDLPTTESECFPSVRQSLHDVVALCDKTLSITSAKGGARKKPGRVTCAMIIVEAWAFVRGRSPGSNNEDAQQACDDYWRVCGGQPIGRGGPANWSRSIRAARAKKDGMRRYIRDEIQRRTRGAQ